MASILHSPVTLKVCNLVATLVTIWLFHFALVRLPQIRQQREVERAAAIRADVAKTAAIFEESKAKFKSKDWGMAAALTRQLLDRDPGNDIYLLQLARSLHHLQRDSEEAATWERYMLVSPTPWLACPEVAEAWARAGSASRSLTAYERCYQLAPQNTDIIFYLARAYERSRRNREAKALYEKGLEIAPGYSDMKVGLGRTYLNEEKPDRAEALAREVLAKSGDNSDALLLLGTALRELGKRAEARTVLERGIAISPRYSDFHYVLGRLAEDEGDRDAALRWYREALSLSPGRGDAKARLAALAGDGS